MNQPAPITTLVAPTSGEDRTREQIEQAVTGHPFCDACGAPTVPVAQGDAIWLDCATSQEHRPLLRRMLSLETLLGHTHQLVIEDVSERLAA
jgi:hypothetical protein